jgi:hypothetical protein
MIYRKECKQLKEELEARSVCALFTNETLFKTQQQLHKKEVELTHAKIQIIELQGLLQERKKGRACVSAHDTRTVILPE